MLLSSEIDKIQKGESKKDEDETYLDLFSHKNMKLKERVLIPVKQYPKVKANKSLAHLINECLSQVLQVAVFILWCFTMYYFSRL